MVGAGSDTASAGKVTGDATLDEADRRRYRGAWAGDAPRTPRDTASTPRQMSAPSSRRPVRWLASACLAAAAAACGEIERPGADGATSPDPLPTVAGTYHATRLVTTRPASTTDLLGDPDTRLDLRLNPDGTTRGQFKVGADPALRGKRDLAGTWRLSVPSRVLFEFAGATFLEDVAFRVSGDALHGEWSDGDLHVSVRLERVP